jgi:hypothetical protein
MGLSPTPMDSRLAPAIQATARRPGLPAARPQTRRHWRDQLPADRLVDAHGRQALGQRGVGDKGHGRLAFDLQLQAVTVAVDADHGTARLAGLAGVRLRRGGSCPQQRQAGNQGLEPAFLHAHLTSSGRRKCLASRCHACVRPRSWHPSGESRSGTPHRPRPCGKPSGHRCAWG